MPDPTLATVEELERESQALPHVRQVGELGEAALDGLHELLSRYGLRMVHLEPADPIPGSHWGQPEAGLVGDCLYLRPDTPVHSALHEACHYVCINPGRRAGLHTDAGGDYDEENAVCYLSIVLADKVPGFGADTMMNDMDAWGYTFRLGSARAWFSGDAEDARAWLQRARILDATGSPVWRLRRAAGLGERS